VNSSAAAVIMKVEMVKFQCLIPGFEGYSFSYICKVIEFMSHPPSSLDVVLVLCIERRVGLLDPTIFHL